MKLKTVTKIDLDKHVAHMYPFWLDRAKHDCQESGLKGHEEDLLNEVILDIYTTKLDKALCMLPKMAATTAKNDKIRTYLKRNGLADDILCEFDFYVLRAIKLNATSPRAPYRWNIMKHSTKKDENIDIIQLDRIESEYDSFKDEQQNKQLEQFNMVREASEEILTENEKVILNHTFLNNERIKTLKTGNMKVNYELKRTAESKIKSYITGSMNVHIDKPKFDRLKKKYLRVKDIINDVNHLLQNHNIKSINHAQLKAVLHADWSTLDEIINRAPEIESELFEKLYPILNTHKYSNIEVALFDFTKNKIELSKGFTDYVLSQCYIKPETKIEKEYIMHVGSVITSIKDLKAFLNEHNLNTSIFPDLTNMRKDCIFDPNGDELNYIESLPYQS